IISSYDLTRNYSHLHRVRRLLLSQENIAPLSSSSSSSSRLQPAARSRARWSRSTIRDILPTTSTRTIQPAIFGRARLELARAEIQSWKLRPRTTASEELAPWPTSSAQQHRPRPSLPFTFTTRLRRRPARWRTAPGAPAAALAGCRRPCRRRRLVILLPRPSPR
uniref:Uncharacterized protein n=1 Tax=Oryza glumipatula TaxID=40148 RepID=A0A0E0AB83_9ORYZ